MSTSTTAINKNPEVEAEKTEEVVISIPPSTNNQSPKMGSPYFEKFPCPAPEISNEPHKYPELPLTRRKMFKEKSNSRFGARSVPIDSQTFENLGSTGIDRAGFKPETPQGNPKAKEKEKEGPDEKEIYKRVTEQLSAKKTRKMTVKLVLELLVFLLILACLICSLVVDRFKGNEFCGLKLWKWFVLLMVIFSGMLVTRWVVHFIVFLIEWKFLLKKNVVYFTHALKTSVVVFIWISLVLVTWVLLFRHGVKRTRKTWKVLEFITWTLASLLIGSFLWVIKTTLIKMLSSSFELNRFFERIQESVFHHYVLQMLSGRPVVGLARDHGGKESHGQVSSTEHTGSHKKVVDWAKLLEKKKEKVPSWRMKLFIDVISNSGLSTMSGLLAKDVVEGGVELEDDKITCEEEAIATAYGIFNNVVSRSKHQNNYMDKEDLLNFMIYEEVELVYPLFEVNESKQISGKAFSKWVVQVYKDRQTLQHALNDNKTAVKQLNKLCIGILIVLMVIIWLLLTEIATTKLLLFFSSQLIVAAFIFGNTCKTIFEAIIFVFVTHPFDVGDRCVVDGTMMVVEEMNILTTVFLKVDKEKVYYPNAVLATKAIGNYYRSPDQGDTLEFAIDYTTPLLTIAKLKDRIKKYLEQEKNLWQPDHIVVVKEIENVNKIKMALIFNHTMNFQDYAEKTRRRSQLVLEMKAIFDDLNIRYNLLPQEILLHNNIATSR